MIKDLFIYCNKIYSIEQQIKIDNLNRVFPNNKQERVRILEKMPLNKPVRKRNRFDNEMYSFLSYTNNLKI